MRSDVLNSNSGNFDASVGGVEFIKADKTLAQSDSGKTFLLDSSAAVAVTLPTDANCSVGCHYSFIVQTANDAAYSISTGDSTDSGGDDFVGGLILHTVTATDSNLVIPAADDCKIVLDANLDNTGGEKGSYLDVIKISSDEWMVKGIVYTDDADSDGTALFVDVD
tara:strand:+ start:81 stop:578 length:498 start_codon:yes stop_codon:yes gene_type:complete